MKTETIEEKLGIKPGDKIVLKAKTPEEEVREIADIAESYFELYYYSYYHKSLNPEQKELAKRYINTTITLYARLGERIYSDSSSAYRSMMIE